MRACLTGSGDAHLFDPGPDAVSQPQLSGRPLVAAQGLSNLPVREAVLLGLQEQLPGDRAAVGREDNTQR